MSHSGAPDQTAHSQVPAPHWHGQRHSESYRTRHLARRTPLARILITQSASGTKVSATAFVSNLSSSTQPGMPACSLRRSALTAWHS